MPIRYKVVTKDTRTSASVPILSKYCKEYKKGTIVKADKETLGIFVFKTEERAYNFFGYTKISNTPPSPKYQVIKVETIGVEIEPGDIVVYTEDETDMVAFYSKIPHYISVLPAPTETICCQEVLVLE